ncbi:peptide-methionine (R)-S-oxide reductase MsrB [Kangiella sediminilitoris]|uniref:2-dehydropantoate 2-reductase n=1 Tax=Kangiella sediminilitoris TaxID=1144748 RepID=A0A1B3B8V5_9GAMM|nr:peptide-methionine (R)-S-oxide reductase MsrB [Kangiella sediminilitoris]AOE49232.1 2-dehydropantoate 2-reductase [Kangiella sediminilitoris]
MISILGAGAIGQLLAHKLTEASIECQLIVKPGHDLDAKQWQLVQQGQPTYHEIKTITASDCDEIRHLWVCVKSHQLQSALQSISHAIDDKTSVVLFQNGMGHDKLAQKYTDSKNIYFASNTHGAFKQSSQVVEHAGEGRIRFGSLNKETQPDWLSENMLSAIQGSWTEDIKSVLWQKLFINAIVNPLTAIHQCKNGDLLLPEMKPMVLALINENQQLAKALDLPIADGLKSKVLDVIGSTANNQSSMLQDVKQGTTTEIDSINGYLLDVATDLGLPMPYNWRLWSQFHIKYPPLKELREQAANSFDSMTYQVTQQHGTEPPFSGSYNLHNDKGLYRCICCHNPLFTDKSKFDSGCGWPSFDRAEDNKAIAYREDTSHGMHRTEILCAQCGSHLGHVFEDGPTETGQRFCVNSVSLDFTKENS